MSERNEFSFVETELLLENGIPEGKDYISYPIINTNEERVLTFIDHPLTQTILKRSETTSFSINAPFSNKEIQGDPLCLCDKGKVVIAQDGSTLRFNFNPFSLHLSNISENNLRSNSSRSKKIILQLYFKSPEFIRDSLRRVARKSKNRGIQSVKDLHIIAQSSNIIIKLIEDHLADIKVRSQFSSKFSAVLSHDIDINFCQTDGYNATSSIESELGVKSTWFFVPKSKVYEINERTIQELDSQGHEIGLHGLSHSGELSLQNPKMLRKQIREAKRIMIDLGVKIDSFRSPFMLRSPTLLEVLSTEGFIVDSSYPDVDTLGLTGGLPGVNYNRPFRPIIYNSGSREKILNIWEVPSSTPQDVQVIEDLALEDEQVLEIWKYKSDFCKDFGGVFVHHSHPWFIANRPEVYIHIIKHLKKEKFEILQMREIGKRMETIISPQI